MIAVILIFYRQKDKHRTIMERKQADYNIPSSIARYYITQYGTETKDMESILR